MSKVNGCTIPWSTFNCLKVLNSHLQSVWFPLIKLKHKLLGLVAGHTGLNICIADSNPGWEMDVCVLSCCLFYVRDLAIFQFSLHRSSQGLNKSLHSKRPKHESGQQGPEEPPPPQKKNKNECSDGKICPFDNWVEQNLQSSLLLLKLLIFIYLTG
jgi:hypothetical protein